MSLLVCVIDLLAWLKIAKAFVACFFMLVILTECKFSLSLITIELSHILTSLRDAIDQSFCVGIELVECYVKAVVGKKFFTVLI